MGLRAVRTGPPLALPVGGVLLLRRPAGGGLTWAVTDPILTAERERRILARDAETLERAAGIIRDRSHPRHVVDRILLRITLRVLNGAARTCRELSGD